MTFLIPNTLALDASAIGGARVQNVDELRGALQQASRDDLPFLALGEGSNVLAGPLIKAYACIVSIRGMREVGRDADSVSLRVGAGENWHHLVCHAHENGLYGLENLALIPGSVGAAPVQNIGAYGVELEQFVTGIEALDRKGQLHHLTRADCEFAYRDSRFKRVQEAQDDLLVITAVTLQLQRRANPVLSYPELSERVHAKADARDEGAIAGELLRAVIEIRSEKLPDPATTPNAGSFFKNPLVDENVFDHLKSAHPQLVGYKQPQATDSNISGAITQSSQVKLSAAQLIDLAGWKKRSATTVACWSRQPLVLVNKGAATFNDVVEYAEKIRLDILNQFGVALEQEPRLLT